MMLGLIKMFAWYGVDAVILSCIVLEMYSSNNSEYFNNDIDLLVI